MMVRARDDIYRMSDLKGKKIGITRSLNTIKNDWWRIQEHQGILLMLRMNGMTEKDIQLIDFPYPDDWYDDPEMLEPMENPSDWQLKRDHKHDLAFRPLETALLEGKVDAIYSQSKVFQHIQEATGEMKAIEDLSRYPDWTLQIANIPAVITCTDVMAQEHPELVVAFMKGMIRVGRWTNEHKRAASAILNKQTYYLNEEDTYRGIRDVDMVPNLSPQNLAAIDIGKDFMVKHNYIKNDFDVRKWAAPEFLAQAATELLEEARGLRPVSAEVRTLHGLLLMDEGRLEEALVTLRAADQVPFEPPFEEYYQTKLVLLTGRVELMAGRTAEALRSAERVLLNQPVNPDALHLAGAAQAELGEFEEAALLFGQALAIKPSDSALLTNAGIVAWRLGGWA